MEDPKPDRVSCEPLSLDDGDEAKTPEAKSKPAAGSLRSLLESKNGYKVVATAIVCVTVIALFVLHNLFAIVREKDRGTPPPAVRQPQPRHHHPEGE